MKGQVLGFDGESGAITSENGERYSFALADWKGQRPPQPKDSVDFVPKDGTATEIYITQSSFASALSNLKPSGGDGEGGSPGIGVAYFAERPQLVLEGIVILAALLLPFISTFIISFTLLGFASVINQTGSMGIMAVLAYAFWLIPLGAGFAIYRELTNARMAKVELWVGILCVLSLVYFIIISSMAGDARGIFSFGFGGIVLVACGVGLILTSMGKLKRIPGM